jgi:hypothetical protein
MCATDPRAPRKFRTLRGFINGKGSDEANYFCFTASLRIFGGHIPFEEISQRLGVQPTNTHRQGERREPRSPVYPEDGWVFRPSLPEVEPLERHIGALWQIVRPELKYL